MCTSVFGDVTKPYTHNGLKQMDGLHMKHTPSDEQLPQSQGTECRFEFQIVALAVALSGSETADVSSTTPGFHQCC